MNDLNPPQQTRQPLFHLTPMVKALLAVNIAVHVLRLLLSERTDDLLVAVFGFIPARLSEAFDLWALATFITYQFLHEGFAHLAINMLFTMAVGTACERRLGAWRVLIYALACGAAGALVHLALLPDDRVVLIGFSGATSGLMAGTLLIATDPHGLRLNQRFLSFSAVWIGLNAITGITGGLPMAADLNIAWVAHIGGYLAGVALIGPLDPWRTRGR
jgi:membrane associated rhomboid family serine protease